MPVQYSYTSTPPMGRTACTQPQCLYSTAIPLLPLWAVWPVHSLSACTVQLYLYSPYGPYNLHTPSVPVQYSYTSTPPIGRTACTEPQCMYKDALYLTLLLPVKTHRTSFIINSFSSTILGCSCSVKHRHLKQNIQVYFLVKVHNSVFDIVLSFLKAY